MAMLATLSAVVLGLLTGYSISSLGEKEGELLSAGVQFIMLDRTLAEYGPETAQIRALLKQLLAERIWINWVDRKQSLSQIRRRCSDGFTRAIPRRSGAAGVTRREAKHANVIDMTACRRGSALPRHACAHRGDRLAAFRVRFPEWLILRRNDCDTPCNS
jgi:hypothetical protein